MRTFLVVWWLFLANALVAQHPSSLGSVPPRTWDTRALSDWATPVANINVRPGHFSEDEYYRASIDNYRTYPVYLPDREPAGYWEQLRVAGRSVVCLGAVPLLSQAAAKPQPRSPLAAARERLFMQAGCAGCHAPPLIRFTTEESDVRNAGEENATPDGFQVMAIPAACGRIRFRSEGLLRCAVEHANRRNLGIR